CVSLWRSVW
nr:immunoglobulin heavy chain junction region [Macaca mulatta]MOX37923.1 immunoglobulin heavy chain junction region [Macaca mulatta]MOX37937.1 immunoglobulin heavy chain junction region [Macaca mulatta]MOX37970.1 immunoglobulin heavy chain junction region [Macaca mulatta]MOX38033.1 immunoglobulin heavy chain junction region [Macaca mulatta]